MLGRRLRLNIKVWNHISVPLTSISEVQGAATSLLQKPETPTSQILARIDAVTKTDVLVRGILHGVTNLAFDLSARCG